MAIPHSADCEMYYKLWREGKSNTEIVESLKFSAPRMEGALPYFLHFSRQKFKEDYREGLTNGNPPLMELTEERRKKFLQMTAAGLPYTQIAKIMNIPLPTIMDVWFIEDPVFKEQVDTVTDLMNARVVQAMYKKAIGYRTTVRSVAKMKGTSDKGIPVHSTTVTKTEKIVDGDFNAQKFWLINKVPKDFSADGFVNNEGNKGTIMKALEDMSQGAPEKDAQFTKEQEERDNQERNPA